MASEHALAYDSYNLQPSSFLGIGGKPGNENRSGSAEPVGRKTLEGMEAALLRPEETREDDDEQALRNVKMDSSLDTPSSQHFH